VELLTDQEALNILAQTVGVERDNLPSEADHLIAECGRLPLAVALCGGMVQSGMPWHDLLVALREHELEFISNEHQAEPQHANLWRAMEVSVRTLIERACDEPLLIDAARRFAELAVFPPDEPIPEATVLTLWSHTGGLSERHARKLIVLLRQRSLVQLTRTADAAQPMVSLHALLFDLAVRLSQRDIGDTKTLSNLLVESYAKQCPAGWSSGPHDGYYFTHLRHHLIEAGRVRELADLLQDLRWLETKNEAGLAFDLSEDFVKTVAALPDNEAARRQLALLGEAVRRDIHFIARRARDYPQGLFQCLWNNCWWYDCPAAAVHYEERQAPGSNTGVGLSRLLEGWRAEKERRAPGFVWVRSLRPPPIHLGTALRAVLRGHEGTVTSVCCDSDGLRLASGSEDGTVRLWDAATGAPLRCLHGHEDRVASVAFAPDGRTLASGSADQTVRLWDAVTGAPLQCLRGHKGRVASVAFAPDGRILASGSWDQTVRVWDAGRGAQRFCLRGSEREVLSVAFAPDGGTLAGGSGETVRVWDTASGAQRLCLGEHTGSVGSVAFAPDGRTLASASADHTVRLWDAATGAPLRCLGEHTGSVGSVAFAPDGRTLASGSTDHTVRLWDVTTGTPLHCFRGHEGRVGSVAFASDGRTLVTGSGDQTVRLWETAGGDPFSYLRGYEGRVGSVAFAPDGRTLASVSGDQTVRLWDTADGTLLLYLRGHRGPVGSVAFAPDGRTLASGADDWTVRVWDVGIGAQILSLRGHERSVGSVAFAPDGRRLASGSGDGTVWVWDTAGCTALLSWNGHKGRVGSVAFAPHGLTLASGGDDQMVRLWDAACGTQLLCLPGHDDWVGSVAYAPDGRTLASGANDGTVRVWDATTGACLDVILGRGDVQAIAGGAARFPWRAVVRGLETVIESAANGKIVGGFPMALQSLATHPAGRLWAGGIACYLALFTLEGASQG
jgi:WD40 repeat protein